MTPSATTNATGGSGESRRSPMKRLGSSNAASVNSTPQISLSNLSGGAGSAGAAAASGMFTRFAGKAAKDALLARTLTGARTANEHRLLLQARVKDFYQEQANIREAGLLEARSLYSTQLELRRLNAGWQNDLSVSLLESEETKVRLAILLDKNLRYRQKMLQQEEAREREGAFRSKMRQKRDAFQDLMKQLEARQALERDDLAIAQRRVAANLQRIEELETRNLDTAGRAAKAAENDKAAQELRMRQQKEAEQLRELQLIKIKHLTEALNREIEDQTWLENMLATHRETEQTLEVAHMMETQTAQTELDSVQAKIKATHLSERQKLSRASFNAQQRRIAKILDKQQRTSEKLRECAMLAQDPLLQASTADGEGRGGASSVGDGSESGSEETDATFSDTGSEGEGEGEGHAEAAVAAATGEGGGPARNASAETQARKRSSGRGLELMEAQEMEVLEQLEKGRERIKAVTRQQRENLVLLRLQQKDQLKMLQTEQRRKLGDLVREQEDEFVQIKADHLHEMDEMIVNMLHAAANAAARGVGKRIDTAASSNARRVPRHIADEISQGKMPEARSYDQVSILHLHVVGFKALSGSAETGKSALRMADQLAKALDSVLLDYPLLFKARAADDTFVIVNGLEKREPTESDSTDQAAELLEFAMDVVDATSDMDGSALGGESRGIPLRIGLHTGTLQGGTLGTAAKPRFGVFGTALDATEGVCASVATAGVSVSDAFRTAIGAMGSDAFAFEQQQQDGGAGDVAAMWSVTVA
ncbi:hypothetical protein BC828DRAFT_209437 [Blastocladiella britannica]|nr:hypothetical protein BC828DRAFT_209437 [Blastocladiella britannica]